MTVRLLLLFTFIHVVASIRNANIYCHIFFCFHNQSRIYKIGLVLLKKPASHGTIIFDRGRVSGKIIGIPTFITGSYVLEFHFTPVYNQRD